MDVIAGVEVQVGFVLVRGPMLAGWSGLGGFRDLGGTLGALHGGKRLGFQRCVPHILYRVHQSLYAWLRVLLVSRCVWNGCVKGSFWAGN